MDISSVLSAVVKRWYVTLVVLALTGFTALQLWQTAVPQYTATTTLTVLPSPSLMQVRAATESGESSLGNPFGVQATGVLAALLAESINSGQIAVPDAAGRAQVAVELSSQNVQSFFTVVAVSDNPQGPNIALQAVTDQSAEILSSIQTTAGAPADQLYTALRTRPEEAVSTSFPDRQRSVLGVVLAGLLLAALLSVAVDAALRAASQRRRARAAKRSAAEAARSDDAEGSEVTSGYGEVVVDEVPPEAERRTGERRRNGPRSLTPVPDAQPTTDSPRRSHAAGR